MYDESGHMHDSKDPNYDSAEEEVCVCVVYIHVSINRYNSQVLSLKPVLQCF